MSEIKKKKKIVGVTFSLFAMFWFRAFHLRGQRLCKLEQKKVFNYETRTLLVELSLACLEISFAVHGAGAVILLFRLEYKTSVICHNVNTQKVKIARRDRPHNLASNRC